LLSVVNLLAVGITVERALKRKAGNEQLRAIVVQQQERDAALTARLERLERLEAAATPRR